jgi:hypothetical protein
MQDRADRYRPHLHPEKRPGVGAGGGRLQDHPGCSNQTCLKKKTCPISKESENPGWIRSTDWKRHNPLAYKQEDEIKPQYVIEKLL